MIHVAIVIVGFRNPTDIERCLAAIARSDYSDYEVVICENGGPEAFADLTRRLPKRLEGGQAVKVFASRNLGYADGVNKGILASGGADAWWVLNPDTEAAPDCLSKQLDRLAKGDCHAVGCTVYLADGRVQSYGGKWRPTLARSISMGFGTPLDTPVDAEALERQQSYLNGASMLVDKVFVETVGLMRTDYFLYCEEVEWFLRAREMGFTLGFASGAHVLHYPGTTTGSYDAMKRRPKAPVYLTERNKMLVTRDRFPRRLPIAACAALANLLLRYGRGAAWKQVWDALSGWSAGLRNQRGIPAWAQTDGPSISIS